MKIFCTNRVKNDIEKLEKLEKKGSYSALRQLLFDFISKKERIEEWMEGSRIFLGNPNFICIKKRLGGSGGYRMYYLLTIHEEQVTIAALYPKFGSKGGSDLTDEAKVKCIGEALDQIKNTDRWKIDLIVKTKSIAFLAED